MRNRGSCFSREDRRGEFSMKRERDDRLIMQEVIAQKLMKLFITNLTRQNLRALANVDMALFWDGTCEIKVDALNSNYYYFEVVSYVEISPNGDSLFCKKCYIKSKCCIGRKHLFRRLVFDGPSIELF